MKELDREDRLRLMKFVCSFAWADLEVKDAERKLVKKLVSRLGLDAAEVAQVDGWLEVPPRPEEVDPSDIPRGHRKLFLDTIRAVIVADGRVEQEEAENLVLFEQLLGD
ncbi:MAG: TerB family tellurite resistance protein [Polyangiales bacterium]